jgi:hypothetical protein
MYRGDDEVLGPLLERRVLEQRRPCATDRITGPSAGDGYGPALNRLRAASVGADVPVPIRSVT